MIVTIDESRVSYPSIKLDSMELSHMIRSYTLHHAVDEVPTLELELELQDQGRKAVLLR